MAATPEPGASWVARPRSRLSALRPTARFRAQLARAGVVVLVVVGIFGTLTLAFGISVLQYALGGMVISSIVIVAAIRPTVRQATPGRRCRGPGGSGTREAQRGDYARATRGARVTARAGRPLRTR